MAKEKSYSYSDGDQHYQWSPDSKWLLVGFLQDKQWTDQIGLVNANGKEEIINLTNSGYGAGSAQWMMNGQMILFRSWRDGMKNHGSWGSEDDAYAFFLTQEAYDNYKLNEEEAELAADAKKEDKDEDEKKDDKKDKDKDAEKSVEPIKLELDDLDDRKVKLTRNSSFLGGTYVNKKGTKLYYLSRFEKGYDLWEMNLKTRETKILKKLGSSNPSDLIIDKDEKHFYLIANGKLKKVSLSDGKNHRYWNQWRDVT